MSWAGLSSTQWVSGNNLQNAVNTGYITATGTIPATDRWIIKSNAPSYVNLNTSNTYYAGKSSNQWLAKRDITPPLINNYCYMTIYYTTTSSGGNAGGFQAYLTSSYNVTSNVFTNYSNYYTGYTDYMPNGSSGSYGSFHNYTSYVDGEYAINIYITSLSPTSDSTYQYYF